MREYTLANKSEGVTDESRMLLLQAGVLTVAI